MYLFDSHCHLQDERIFPQLKMVLDRANKAGVRYLTCYGTNEGDWQKVASIAKNYPSVIPGFGLHPWYVGQRNPQWLSGLEDLLQKFPSAAIGEIGIDRMIPGYNEQEQILVFKQQLHLARKTVRPVSIHCRKGWGKLVSVLKDEKKLPAGGVLHSFSGSAEILGILEKLGLYISFSGVVTNPKHRRSVQNVRTVSIEKMLVETDSPDLIPAGTQERYNEPANLHVIITKIAQIRSTSFEEIAQKTLQNAQRLFFR